MEAEQGSRGASLSTEGNKSADHKPENNPNDANANSAHPGGPVATKLEETKPQSDVADEKRESSSQSDGRKEEIIQASSLAAKDEESKMEVEKESAATPATDPPAASGDAGCSQRGEASAPNTAQAKNAGDVEDSHEPEAVDDEDPVKTVYNITDGFRVYCLSSSKKARSNQKFHATMRYDLEKCNWEFAVKNGEEEKKITLKVFCQKAGNNAKGKTRCREQIHDADTGELVHWQRLDLQAKELRKKAGVKLSSNPTTYKSYKRRREEDDSDDDEETSWARAQKQCEAQERFERNETFQARRKAEQEALNNSFFRIHGRKKDQDESMYGLDLTSNVLLEGHGCRQDTLAAERVKKLHDLIQSGKIKEDGDAASVPFIRHEELNTDSELLNKVSREFVKTSRIYVKEGRLVQARAEYDPSHSKEFHKQYLAGRIEAPAVVEHSVPLTPKRSVGRYNKLAAGGQQPAAHAQPGSMNIAQTRIMNGSKMEAAGAWAWESEEIKLFDALFACYDDDSGTLARLLRTKTERQVKEMIARSKDDVRCEVCRNPEDEEKMLLCEKCDKGYHTFCLCPPLSAIPEGDWFCDKCTSHSSLRGTSEPADAIAATKLEQEGGDEGWWDTKSLRLQPDLEQRAVDELVASVNELSFGQLRRAGQEEEGNLSKLSLQDVHWPLIKSIFSVCLLTCPVPMRNEPSSVIVDPLRRHLRVIVAAVRKAFALEEILAVSDAREQGLDKIEEEPLYASSEDRSQAWIFQVNTQLCDLDRLLQDQKELRCLIGRHSTRIQAGDKVFIWRGGEVCYEYGRIKPVGGSLVAVGHAQSRVDTRAISGALAEYCTPLCTQLQAFEKRPSCAVSISHILANPVSVSTLRQNKACAGLPILISSAGSVFKLNEQQVKVLDEALVAADPAYTPQTTSQVRQASASSKRLSQASDKEPQKEVKSVARGHFTHPDVSDGSDNDGEEDEKDSDNEPENSERRPNWMRQCAVILAKIKRHRDAKPFLKPVDVVGLGLVDYLDVLKQEGCEPIDFETIDSNLNGNVYKRDSEFCKDIRRVFYNANVYNPEDDVVYRMARNISGEFEQSWAKYKRDKRKRRNAAGPRKKGEKDAAKNSAEAEDQGEDGKQNSSLNEKGSGGDAMDVSVEEGQRDEVLDQEADREASSQGGQNAKAESVTAAELAGSAHGSSKPEDNAMDIDTAKAGGDAAACAPDQKPVSGGQEAEPGAQQHADGAAGASEAAGKGAADAPGVVSSGDAMQVEGAGEVQRRCMVCDGFAGTDTMIFCDASGAGFHLKCLEDPITTPPDGPWVSPMSVLQSKRRTQHASGGEGSLHPSCPACRQAASDGMMVCGGCKQKYHPQCVRSVSVLSEDRICLCRECEGLLPATPERQMMLQVLLRREVLVECRRLLHLHCELCSRDRQRDLDTELHRFRVLKQTARLGDRIFEFNRVLLEEANGVLGQVFSAIP